jgi:dihydropteroate synthase
MRMSSPTHGTTPSGPLLPAGSPRIVGIVNITAELFSDGGRYLDPVAALAHARTLRAEGADIIKLGPAASHPGSAPVTAGQEQRRLAPVLEQFGADGVPVSVDSFRPDYIRTHDVAAACSHRPEGHHPPGSVCAAVPKGAAHD